MNIVNREWKSFDTVLTKSLSTPQGFFDWIQSNLVIPAPTADSVKIYMQAGVDVGGHRLLMLSGGRAIYFDPTNINNINKFLGISTNASITDDNVGIVTKGLLINIGWGLIPDATYFASSDGLISTTPILSGINLVVGIAIDSDTLDINFSQPYIKI